VHAAKNIVAAGLAERCEVQVSYAIGVAEPISIMVESFGTSPLSAEHLPRIVRKHFDLTPYGLREMLDLVRPSTSRPQVTGISDALSRSSPGSVPIAPRHSPKRPRGSATPNRPTSQP